jgi:hypothetical protein
MTLVSKLRKKLAEDVSMNERHEFQLDDAEHNSAISAVVLKRDGLSLLLSELRVRRPAPAALKQKAWGEGIAARVTSLLEPLQVLEIDSLRNQALLRSAISAVHPDSPTYFEVLLDGTTGALLHRYQAANSVDAAGHHARRELVPFALTHEALVKLVADILA